jgi:hypothetical protein
MIHVMPAPLPLETVLAWRRDERANILAYGAALAQDTHEVLRMQSGTRWP